MNSPTNAPASTEQNFLSELFNSGERIHIYLVNGVRLTGSIRTHDKVVIELEGPTKQIVYKHSISTILRD